MLDGHVASVEELRTALRALRPGEADAYLQTPDAMITSDGDSIVQAANAIKLPSMFQDREAVDSGALASAG